MTLRDIFFMMEQQKEMNRKRSVETDPLKENWKMVDTADLNENLPDDEVKSHDHVIVSLRMALSGYKHDLKKIEEAYNKKVVDSNMYYRVSATLQTRIKEYDNAIKIIKEWEEENED